MRVFIIAEAGVNHNGDFDLAVKLIDAAAAAAADAVKFQTFRASALASASAPKAEYQKQTTDPTQSQLEMLKGLELPREWHGKLKRRAEDRGLTFMSTAFDGDSLDFLVRRIGIERIKIPSGELTNGPLLLQAAKSDLPIILSTGMATPEEIEAALGVLAFGYLDQNNPGKESFDKALASSEGRNALQQNVILLHCTTEYPAPYENIDLNAMGRLSDIFGLPTGLSDHSSGIAVPIAATAMGAAVIEKHFTLDRTLRGPDHQASLEPWELDEMIRSIRAVESAMGPGQKKPKGAERQNMTVARKSLVALRPIGKGETFTRDNMGPRRPGGGLSPMDYWKVIGTPSIKAFRKGENIEL